MLRGTLTHLAIRRLVMGQYRLVNDPPKAVHDALHRLRDDEGHQSRCEYLRSLEDDDLDELAADAINDLTTFITDWPELPGIWMPCMEERRRYEGLIDGDIVVRGRYDLTLGKPDRTRARRLIVDLKTGAVQAGHASEARFYALLETLRVGVPPFRVGSYYLKTGRLMLELVDEGLLYQAAGRLADGIRKMWEINAGREPTATPSGFCTHCSLYLGCSTGISFVELRESA